MRRRRWRVRFAAPIRRRSCRATTVRCRSSTRWPRSPGAAPPRRARYSRRAPPPAPWARWAVSPPAYTLLNPSTPARWHEADTDARRLRRHRERRPPADRRRRTHAAGPRGCVVGRRRIAVAPGRRIARPALLRQQRTVRRPHLADLQRPVRRDLRRELDAGHRRRLLLVERHAQHQRRELLEDRQGDDRDRQRAVEVLGAVDRLLRRAGGARARPRDRLRPRRATGRP